MKNIFLVGLRGSGKTTLGKNLSKKYQRSFYDCDKLLTNKFGKNISEIVSEKGWDYFREQESIILQDIGQSGGIISTGGGVVLAEVNRDYIKANGICFFLNPPLEILIERLTKKPLGNQRPSFGDESLEAEIKRVYAERLEFYMEISDFQVNTFSSMAKNVAEITCFLKAKSYF